MGILQERYGMNSLEIFRSELLQSSGWHWYFDCVKVVVDEGTDLGNRFVVGTDGVELRVRCIFGSCCRQGGLIFLRPGSSLVLSWNSNAVYESMNLDIF